MSLAAAVDANPAGWFDILRLQPGAEVDEARRCVLTGIGFPLCNSVLFPAFGDDEVDEVLAAARARGVPLLWWLGADEAGIARRLEERGVVVDGETMPGMALELAELDPIAAPAELRVTRVRGAAELDAFAVPFGEGFGIAGDALASVLAAFAARGVDGDDLQHWLGTVDGQPVACASVLTRDGVAGLYDVATVHEARGRGYGAALSLAALLGARRAGASGAVLHASPDGMGIYERLGFRTLSAVRSVVTSDFAA